MNYFVTAIDTDSGKTLVSAILCEALEADYWKPIQAGLPRDADTVRMLVSNHTTKILPETYLLNTPASPHASAKIDKVKIKIEKFNLPNISGRNLIIEGAGGCLVPINDEHFVIDIISKLNVAVILVSDLYLGSINHTLLTVEALRKRKLVVKGIIFNGESNSESERIIMQHSNLKPLLHIKREPHITRDVVKHYANVLKRNLDE
jgi:dethiobiotin synthetase